MPWLRLLLVVALSLLTGTASAQPKPYRLPSVDLKQRVIWGSEATTPEGLKLLFGGLDQDAVDGTARTRIVMKEGEELSLKHDAQHASRVAQRKKLQAEHSKADETLAKDRSSYLSGSVTTGRSAEQIRAGQASLQGMTAAVDALGDEPSARALSPLAYDPHTKLFVVFGGDHLDYVMNDLWVFDPQELRWDLRHPPKSPAPRANHRWKVMEGGKLELTGGYRYTSSTDYMGGQYIDHDDGPWVYDIAKNEWSGEGKLVASDQREYRAGPFHPDYFLQGVPPDMAATQKKLEELPANTWVAMKPPYLPQLNRDWGSAVMAGEDMILRWAGGHSAHGGTDVLHYHINTNRWELARPVEFPLGQLYTNTEYPRGVSFNGQAWITGHTYQSYGYDPTTGMLFVGQPRQTFIYDVAKASWRTPGLDKPAGMNYDSCFYTLTLCATAQGVFCWTNEGRIFQWQNSQWNEWKLSGKKLPGSSVDNSTLTYDSNRKQLYFFRKSYGDDHRYDGIIHTLDLTTKEVSELKPAGAEAAAQISYLCQIRYDIAGDLLLCGCTLPPDEEGGRRTPAYDPAKNRWISLKITGDDPHGPKGRNVSLGMMYDAKRRLFWAVDAKSQVFAMHLHRATADEQPLK